MLAGGPPNAAEIIRLTNQARLKAGLPPVQWNTTVQKVAQDYAGVMARAQKLDHHIGGGDGGTRLAAAGYGKPGTFWWAENIADGYPDSNAVVTGWLKSPPHRANILNPHVTQIGVGIAYDTKGVPYYCQLFAAPPGS